jgi:citrate synthase
MCFASIRQDLLDAAVINALEYSELPELQLKVINDDGASAKIQEAQLKKLEQKLAEYLEQEEAQYELLEQKKYTQALFDRRHAALCKKMDDCRDQIMRTKASMPKAVDYAERLATLQTAIAALKDPDATAEEQNKILKSIVESIEYSSVPCAPENKNKYGPRGVPFPFSISVKLRL